MTMDITFRDYFRLTRPTDEQVDEWKDYMGGMTSYTNRGLRVIMEATHAGLLNANERFYIPSRMAEGVSTFRTGEKPTKIMKHHNLESDPVGVIRGARFVPTVPDELEDNPDVQNLMSSSAPIKTQLKSIRNLWRAGVFQQDGWRGLGYIQLIGDVYDENTIDQVNDGRFDAVSTNFRSPGAAYCLLCAQNWAVDGFCEHEWGELYTEGDDDDDDDGFKFPALPIPGIHQYLETSFVALEGDKLVTVQAIDKTNNDNNKTIFLPDNFNWEENSINSTEPIFEFKDFEEDKMAQPVKKGKNILSDTEQKVFDTIKKLRKDTEEKILTDFAKKISAMRDKNGLLPDQEEAELDDETAIVYALENLETADQTIDDAKIEEIEGLYQEEFQKMKEEDLLTDEGLEDAKLSAKKRKSLPKTTFCGPKRSFPVPDCAHVTAARRLIGRYKGPGDKANILACVNRKAKALGCDSKQDDLDPKPPVAAELVSGTEDSLKDIKDQDLQSLHLAIEVELVKRGKKMAYECKECALYKETAETASKEVADAKKTTQELEGVLTILREEYARTQAEYVDQVDAYVLLSASAFAEKIEKFAQIGVLTGKYDSVDSAKEAIQGEDLAKVEASLAAFDWKAAAEKFNDGMGNNNPEGTVDNPVIITDGDNIPLPEGLGAPAVEAVENIRELVNAGQISDARHIYATMKKLKLFPDELTFESISAVDDKSADN